MRASKSMCKGTQKALPVSIAGQDMMGMDVGLICGKISG